MRRNQDGYILVYVLVVILALSMFAVGLMSHALKNHNIQKNAVTYTQEKYVAEGMIEQFVAELTALTEDDAPVFNDANVLVDGIKSGFSSGVAIDALENDIYLVTANSGTVSVKTEIEISYTLTETDESKYKVANITTKYITYEITQGEDAG